MSKLKKVLLMCTAYVLVAALAIGGTIAYLRDSDSDVNVMTLGNVSIRQNEEQRVDPSKNGTLTEADIEDFEQAKPIYPYVDVNLNGAMGDDYEEITFPNGQTNKLFIGDNAIDKLVSVTNTGKTDAYVRTIIALEAPTDKIDLSFNSTDWKMDKTASSYSIEVDGVKYDLFVCEYKNVLKPGETTPYSLMQIILDGTATNEDAAAYGNTYDVLVLSQAVQTAGFDSAAVALDTAFGKPSEKAAEWFGGITVPTGAGYNGSFVPAPEGAVLVNGTDKAAVLAAIEAAQPGDVVALTEDTTIAGSAAYQKLIINKNITLNLNGKTLTTECGWGGIDLKNGASIVNGTINHTGNTAAIKAFQAGKIENVIINVTETAGKIKGGIVVQEGAGCYVGSIKNVTINGATNGIETYRCGDRTGLAIGSMENVTINAIDTGISLSAPIGEVKNCTIKGAKIGVNAYLYGPYSVTADFINCVIEGADADIYAHDEVGKTNPGSITVTYDSVMSLGLNVISEIEAEAAGRVFIGIK